MLKEAEQKTKEQIKTVIIDKKGCGKSEQRQEIIKYWVNEKVVKAAINLLNIIKQNIVNNPRGLKSFIQTKGYFFKNIQNLKQV